MGKWLLGIIAALEAVAIVALLLTRTDEPELQPLSVVDAARARPGRATTLGSTPTGRSAAGLVPLPEPVSGDAAPQLLLPLPDGDPSLGILIYGTVTSEQGGSLERYRAVVAVSGRNESVPASHGTYAITGLSPGPVTLSCSADGFVAQSATLELDHAQLVDRHDFRLAISPLVPVSFRTPDGGELQRSLITDRVPGQLRAIATSESPPLDVSDSPRSSAHWRNFEGLGVVVGSPAYQAAGIVNQKTWDAQAAGWDGVLTLSEPPPVYVSAVWNDTVLATQRIVDESGVTFTLPADSFAQQLCTVSARVVDQANGRPVAGVLAQFGGVVRESGATGEIRFERMAPGTRTLFLHPPGAWIRNGTGWTSIGLGDAAFWSFSLAVEFRAGQTIELGDLPLRRTVSVRGYISSAKGSASASSVSATAADAPTGEAVSYSTLRTQVDEQSGVFHIRVLPGRWSFQTTSESKPVVIDVTGDVEDLRLDVSAAASER